MSKVSEYIDGLGITLHSVLDEIVRDQDLRKRLKSKLTHWDQVKDISADAYRNPDALKKAILSQLTERVKATDIYKRIGTTRGATQDEIVRDFRKTQKAVHPDLNAEQKILTDAVTGSVNAAKDEIDNPSETTQTQPTPAQSGGFKWGGSGGNTGSTGNTDQSTSRIYFTNIRSSIQTLGIAGFTLSRTIHVDSFSWGVQGMDFLFTESSLPHDHNIALTLRGLIQGMADQVFQNGMVFDLHDVLTIRMSPDIEAIIVARAEQISSFKAEQAKAGRGSTGNPKQSAKPEPQPATDDAASAQRAAAREAFNRVPQTPTDFGRRLDELAASPVKGDPGVILRKLVEATAIKGITAGNGDKILTVFARHNSASFSGSDYTPSDTLNAGVRSLLHAAANDRSIPLESVTAFADRHFKTAEREGKAGVITEGLRILLNSQHDQFNTIPAYQIPTLLPILLSEPNIGVSTSSYWDEVGKLALNNLPQITATDIEVVSRNRANSGMNENASERWQFIAKILQARPQVIDSFLTGISSADLSSDDGNRNAGIGLSVVLAGMLSNPAENALALEQLRSYITVHRSHRVPAGSYDGAQKVEAVPHEALWYALAQMGEHHRTTADSPNPWIPVLAELAASNEQLLQDIQTSRLIEATSLGSEESIRLITQVLNDVTSRKPELAAKIEDRFKGPLPSSGGSAGSAILKHAQAAYRAIMGDPTNE